MRRSKLSHHFSVSVIIPVYNADQYLRVCLDSVLLQTLTNVEIICVDDGSTDSSSNILEEYADWYENIQLLKNTENSGEGSARNNGLAKARGDYIFHLDADDEIPASALEILYDQAVLHGSEMVKGSHILVDTEGTAGNLISPVPVSKTVNTNIYASKFLKKIPRSHCTYLYQRSFLDEFSIRYPTDFVVGVDVIMLTKALLSAKNVTVIPDVVYHYRQSKDSATRGVLSARVILEGVEIKKIVYELLVNNGLLEAGHHCIKNWCWQIDTYWVYMANNLPMNVYREVFSSFRMLVSPKVVPWMNDIGHQYRYLLALVLAEKDREAVDFLSSGILVSDFSSQENLAAALDFVLTQVPDDLGALRAREDLNKT